MNDSRLKEYLRSLPLHEAGVWRQRLDRQRTDCGCRIGLIVMLAVLAIWIVCPMLGPPLWQRTAITGVIVACISGIAGKLLGLVVARIRFGLIVRALRQQVEAAGRERRRTPGPIPAR